jgi:phosphoribosylamine--glycine ligase
MKILVVGGGGREHALAWRISCDSTKPEIFCAPGNAGTESIATNLEIGAEDIEGIVAWAAENRPDLTVIGPEAPLCLGLADQLTEKGLKVFGPGKEGAQLEGSKVFCKDVMISAGVPTAGAESFTDSRAALAYLSKQEFPIVIKADGLAAGKGVIICSDLAEAEKATKEILDDKVFGEAGSKLVVEDFLDGEEASILALTDGENIVMLESSQDHKRVFNNDQGPNTGGMGAYSPAPVVTDDLKIQIMDVVLKPVVAELRKRGIKYQGVLYAGLMMTEKGPMVLEFNCRFGDPETQAVLPRIDKDIVPALMACAEGNLAEEMISWKPQECVCVVMASGGYPGSYEKGKEITGLAAANDLGATVFHAGTNTENGKTVTAGGRVLGVTALGDDLQSAVKTAYEAISRISFDQAQYRTDIAARALRRKK